MGFLGKLFGKKENDTIENTVTQQITTEKDLQNQNDEESNSPMMPIDMSKHQENLNTVLINMSKDNKIDMTKHVARVALAMDYSGSMSNLFRNGSVQETVSRLLPIALRFDDNGELESWLFSNGSERLAAVTKDNYSTYVRKVMNKANMSMGGTNYAPVLKEMVSYYKDTPVYNFINDRFVDESAVLRPLSWHLILYVFRYFSRKWQTISDCECPDLIQNETPVRFLYGTQKNVRSDRAESSWHSN